nr:transposase [Nostoc sp. ChiQUE02]MDZ8234778.1 transposase [Nostoc sp. ChiQUE02]
MEAIQMQDVTRQMTEITVIIEAAVCQLVYLPPYSPDLNRIEKCWATLKSRIRKLLLKSDNLRDAMEIVLKQAAS